MDFDEGAGTNQPPVAVPQTDVASGTTPIAVAFNGSESYDSDGSIMEYSWTFGDGGVAAGASATHSYNAPGSYPAVCSLSKIIWEAWE
jgi:PKD repeat protein